MNFLQIHFPAWLICVFFAGLSAIISYVSLKITKRFFSPAFLKENSDAITNYVNVICVLYSIVLAFVVLSTWKNYQHSQENLEKEAHGLGDIYRDMAVFPDSLRNVMRDSLGKYISIVINREWKEQENGEEDEEAHCLINDLPNHIVPRTPQELTIFPFFMEHYNTVMVNRRIRVLNGGSDIPVLIWSILLLGAIIMIFLSGFYYMEHQGMKFFLSATMSSFIAILLFIAFALNSPFKGSTKLKPEPFEQLGNHTFKQNR